MDFYCSGAQSVHYTCSPTVCTVVTYFQQAIHRSMQDGAKGYSIPFKLLMLSDMNEKTHPIVTEQGDAILFFSFFWAVECRKIKLDSMISTSRTGASEANKINF